MISLTFIIGGGPLLTFDYRVNGGPDNGRRVTLAPTRLRGRSLDYARNVFSSDPSEFDRVYAPCHRPRITSPDPDGRDGQPPLHPDTVAICMVELAALGRGFNADGSRNEDEISRMCAEYEAARRMGTKDAG